MPILIVDDDANIAHLLEMLLTDEQYNVAVVQDGQEALDWLQLHDPSVILLDLGLPRVSGEEVLQHLESADSRAKVVVISARLDARAVASRYSCVSTVVPKPFDADDVIHAVEQAKAS